MKTTARFYCWVIIYTPPNMSVSYGYYSLNTPQRATTRVNGTELFYSGYWYPTVGDDDYNKASTRPQFFNYRDSAGTLLNGYTYLYDTRGNIVSETDNAQNDTETKYAYDNRNRLVSVKNGSGSVLHSYTYDTAGNILSKTDGGTVHTYTYGNAQWKDQLTAFDGRAITYDGAGNPLTYYNGASYTLTWQRGRQLAGVTKGTTTATYAYDMAGVRSAKTVNGVTYEFTTLSGKLMRQTWSGNEIQIIYDAYGRPYLLLYTPANGTTQTYYYVLNVQNDVVGLMDGNLNVVVRYSYDPYGKPTGTTASSSYAALAAANPLRYRSYYYDAETGFYYLQSRYYDPNICRFINADSYLTTDITDPLSYNMFAYCEGNPVMYSDPTGEVGKSGAILGVLSGGISGLADYWLETVLNDESFEWLDAAGYMAKGAFEGAIEGLVKPKTEKMIKVAIYLKDCIKTLSSNASLEEMLIAIGYDGVYLIASISLEKTFKGNDKLVDEVAKGIADMVIHGNTSTLKGISKTAVKAAYNQAQTGNVLIVASPGSARTIAAMTK